MKKVILSTLAASFTAICSAATTYDLANGNVTVPANTEAIITQSNNGTATGNTISIGDGATVTLAGINGGEIACSGDATIILADGTANVCANDSWESSTIFWPNGKTLTIKGGTAGTGTLSVENKFGRTCEAAAIGSSKWRSSGHLVIEGGEITAKAYGYGPPIGAYDKKCGNITIRGGSVTAQGSGSGNNAGIGGYCNNIYISGGTVVARGGSMSAGIGSSYYSGGKCGNISISGNANVTAIGGNRAAGIGSGYVAECGNISITGGIVAAYGSNGGAGIGAGDSGSGPGATCGTITIANTVTKVVAKKGGDDVYSYIGKADNYSSVGTVTLGNKLKKTYSNDNLSLTLQPAYTIIWKDDNGTTLETDTEVILGTTPTYNGATPTKASTAQYSYTFKGWSPTVAAATADKTYTATYNATVRSYKVTWKDDDGTTLRVDSVQYGTSPGYGEEPTRDGYAFDGWFTAVEGGDLLSEGTIVTKNMSFFAHWTRSSFLAGEDVACAGVNVTLASAQAEWLNGLGDYETVKTAVATMEADKFEEAYLLNLDLTNAERGYAFEVVGIDARGAEVVVTVRLVRSGAVQSYGGKNAPINGVLRLYGSKTPEKNGFVPMADAVVSDATFASGETAKLTLSKSGENRFFHAVVAAP